MEEEEKEEEEVRPQDSDEINLDLINNITKDEILDVLSSYETKSDATIIGGGISTFLGAFAFLGGLGTWIASLIGEFGLSYIGLSIAGIGFGTGIIATFLFVLGVGYFLKKSMDKSNIDEINEYEKIIKNKETLEYKIFKDFNQSLEIYLIQNLSPLITNVYNMLKEIGETIELDNQNYLNKFGEKLLEKVKKEVPIFHNSDKFSILVLGKTGVGKTTLINTILNQEQKGVGAGKPMKMENTFEKNSNENLFPGLSIYDSRGIELSKEFSIEQYSIQVLNFIQNGLDENKIEIGEKLKNSKNFIHCIWYCITGSRIESAELDYIKRLKAIYSSDKKLPIIFVFTQADNNKKFIEPIKNEIIKELNDANINFIPVISLNNTIELDDMIILRGKKGFRQLMEKSLNLAKQGFESVFFGNIQKQFTNILLYFLSNKPVAKSLESIQNNISSLLKEKKFSNLKQIYQIFPDCLVDSLVHIYFEHKTFEDNKSENKLKFDEWKKKFIELYKKNEKKFKNLIDKKTLYSFVEIPIKKFYDEKVENELSKIKDYDLNSVHDKLVQEAQIKKLLEPKKKKLEKFFYKIIDNYTAHHKELITNFIILYLEKEFFDTISLRLETNAMECYNRNKNKINSYVQEVAGNIYNNLSKKIDLDKIPKDEKDKII